MYENKSVSENVIIADAVIIKYVYKHNSSSRAFDEMEMARYKIHNVTSFKSFQSRLNSLYRYVGVPINCLKMVTCSNCGDISFGCLILCPLCHSKEVRRLQGCKVRNCPANNSVWEKMSDEEKNNLSGKEICIHNRTSSPQCVISETPLSHIVTLTNLRMDNRFIYSTPQEIHSLIKECKEKGIPCPILTKNVACCLYAFGEIELATEMFNFLLSFEDPSTIRESMMEGAELFSQVNSIENLAINWSIRSLWL